MFGPRHVFQLYMYATSVCIIYAVQVMLTVFLKHLPLLRNEHWLSYFDGLNSVKFNSPIIAVNITGL